jgi:hypothetical protein
MKPGFLKIKDVKVRIDEVVGVYEVWPMEEYLPFPRFVLKVVHRGCGDYQATPNICVRNANTGDYEYTCGLGGTPDQAMLDAIENLFLEVGKQAGQRTLTEEDFVFDHPGY